MDYYKEFTEGFVETSLGKIFYRHHDGIGRRMIFLHGLGATTRVWLRFVNFLPEEIDVYLIDLLGHGKSDAPEIEYTMEKQVLAVSEFVKNMEIDEPCVFGHSYGGWVAIAYALNGGSYSSLILESPAGLQDYFDDLRSNPEKMEERKQRVRKEISYLNGEKPHVFENILSHEFYDHELTHLELNSISKPTLIVWGSKDDVVEERFGRVIHNYITGSTLRIIEGVGHNPHYTNPDEVAKIVLGFLGY